MVRLHCTQPIWSLSLGFKKKKQWRLLRDTDIPPLPILHRRSSQHKGAEVHRAEEPFWASSTPRSANSPLGLRNHEGDEHLKSFLASPKACVAELSARSGWFELLRAPPFSAECHHWDAGLAWIAAHPKLSFRLNSFSLEYFEQGL